MDIISDRIDDIKDSEFDKDEVEKAFHVLSSNDFGFVAMGSISCEPDKNSVFSLASNIGTYKKGENLFIGVASLIQTLGAREKLTNQEMFASQVSLLCSIYGVDFKLISGLVDILNTKKAGIFSLEKNSVLN